jgi:hypothetical protein
VFPEAYCRHRRARPDPNGLFFSAWRVSSPFRSFIAHAFRTETDDSRLLSYKGFCLVSLQSAVLRRLEAQKVLRSILLISPLRTFGVVDYVGFIIVRLISDCICLDLVGDIALYEQCQSPLKC